MLQKYEQNIFKENGGKPKMNCIEKLPDLSSLLRSRLFGIRRKARSSNETRKTKHYQGPVIRSLSRVGLGLVLVTQGDF